MEIHDDEHLRILDSETDNENPLNIAGTLFRKTLGLIKPGPHTA